MKWRVRDVDSAQRRSGELEVDSAHGLQGRSAKWVWYCSRVSLSDNVNRSSRVKILSRLKYLHIIAYWSGARILCSMLGLKSARSFGAIECGESKSDSIQAHGLKAATCGSGSDIAVAYCWVITCIDQVVIRAYFDKFKKTMHAIQQMRDSRVRRCVSPEALRSKLKTLLANIA